MVLREWGGPGHHWPDSPSPPTSRVLPKAGRPCGCCHSCWGEGRWEVRLPQGCRHSARAGRTSREAARRAGACTTAWLELAPRHAAQPHDHSDSDQQQAIQDKEGFIFRIKSPQTSPWSVMLLEAVLVSMVPAATRNHVHVHEPCCDRLPWTTKLLRQVWMSADSSLRTRDIEGVCANLPRTPPHPRTPKREIVQT